MIIKLIFNRRCQHYLANQRNVSAKQLSEIINMRENEKINIENLKM